MKTLSFAAAALALLGACSTSTGRVAQRELGDGVVAVQERRPVEGWLSWRGPLQTGASLETGLFERVTLEGPGHLWSYPLSGRGTPAVGGGRVYALGYAGRGKDLQERLVCLDEDSGELLWERRWNDFLSDVIYDRYSIGAPTLDPETGDVYVIGTAGELMAFSAEGEPRWQRSLTEELGRLSFPNGRTGAVVVDGELLLLHVISSHWGPNGPARDRFYAFDKRSGACVWVSTPGVGPKDSSFSYPVLEWRGGRRVLYAGTGCGNVVAVDAHSGDPLWRFQLATGGLNSACLIHDDSLIVIHGKENVDTSVIGRMIALKLGAEPGADAPGPRLLDGSHELWRNDLVAFSSSPVLVDGLVYVTDATGELVCVDADTGAILWAEKLAADQIHASPVWADGKLYVPMNDGSFHIVRPSRERAEVLQSVQLEGNCLGAPAVEGGRVYVHTTEKLYCFGSVSERPAPVPAAAVAPAAGAAVRLQVIPGDVLVHPGQRLDVRVRGLDAKGRVVPGQVGTPAFQVPPTLDLDFEPAGALRVPDRARLGVGVVKASADGLSGSMRVRVVPLGGYAEDFEGFQLSEESPGEPGVRFAHPPGQWLGGRPKWDVRELQGDKVLAKTLDNPLFQRAMGFFGHPDDSDYTVQVDLLTDGNRRTLSSAGVVNQRYLIALKGNYQELEISSNMERVKETTPFKWKAGTWYTLKTRVDVAADGSGVVRAKAWERGTPEPEGWTLEVEHANAHTHGAPGFWGFAPQSRFRVYLDNFVVTPNE